jgi:hypothetical protein
MDKLHERTKSVELFRLDRSCLTKEDALKEGIASHNLSALLYVINSRYMSAAFMHLFCTNNLTCLLCFRDRSYIMSPL